MINKVVETDEKKKEINRINTLKKRLSIDRESLRSSISSMKRTMLRQGSRRNSKISQSPLNQPKNFYRRSTLFHQANTGFISESLLPLVEEEKYNF